MKENLEVALRALNWAASRSRQREERDYYEHAVQALQGLVAPSREKLVAEVTVLTEMVRVLSYRVAEMEADKTLQALHDENERLGLYEPEQEPDRFCDANCTWSDHHPDCKYGTQNSDELTIAYMSGLYDGKKQANPEQEPVAFESLLGAIARGWCHEKNANKEMDSDLAIAIAAEVKAIYTTPPQPEQEPVAWMHNFIDGGISIGKRPADLKRHPDRWTALYKDPKPCPTCEALARTVMLDQTSHDQFKPDWDTQAVLVEEMQRMAKRISELEAQPEQPKVRTGDCLLVGVCASEGHKIAPQRTWVELTESEKIAALYDKDGITLDYEDYADAIEAKSREKNQ